MEFFQGLREERIGSEIMEIGLMQPRERMLTLLRGGVPDKLPFFHTDHHLLRGDKEREARNRGMGIIVYRPSYVESISNVEILTETICFFQQYYLYTISNFR